MIDPLIVQYAEDLAAYGRTLPSFARTSTEIHAALLRAFKCHIGDLFLWLPGVNDRWSPEVAAKWNRDHSLDHGAAQTAQENHIHIRVHGCTWSGRPETWLLNTIQNLCYNYFYLTQVGIHTEVLAEQPSVVCFLRVSGDDTYLSV